MYLTDRLRHERIVIVEFKHLIENPPPQEIPIVFLFDLSNLAISLSRSVRALQEKFPGGKQMVLLQKVSADQISGLLELGVGGFLEYEDVSNHLLTAIREIATGDSWLSPTLSERMRGAWKQFARREAAGERSRLTMREFDIVQLARCRLSNKEIAAILGIRQSTVKFHLANIFNKLNISSRDELSPPVPPDEALASFLTAAPPD